ncbi:hypothetical protein H8957_010308 [Semnopithecus entellus]
MLPPAYMYRLLFFLLAGALLVLCWSPMKEPTRSIICTSCGEFVDKTCRKNPGSCQSKHPDFACQTKEVYIQHFTGEYVYQYSVLGCPKRCVEYIRFARREKNIFFCCNGNYCNSLSVKDNASLSSIPLQKFA